MVLTETHESIKPEGYDYHLSAKPDRDYHSDGESFVTIWSRYPLTEIPTSPDNKYFTVCAYIHDPEGIGNIIVYGTIITYGGDGVRDGLARQWERHRAAVKSQSTEWNTLKQCYPNHLRIIAGDFNENLDGKSWYGVKDAKEAILKGLELAGMQCPTAAKGINLLVGDDKLSRSTVDHICVSKGTTKIHTVRAWEGFEDGIILSDHNGIAVETLIDSSKIVSA